MGKERRKEGLSETDYQALSALLDFHSDRAVAHASFLVACVFGLFTVLSLIKGNALALDIVYSVAYWVLWSGGLYSLVNFGKFAAEADRIKRFIEKRSSVLGIMDKEIQTLEKSLIESIFYHFKLWKHRPKLMSILYFLFIGLLPWFYTMGLSLNITLTKMTVQLGLQMPGIIFSFLGEAFLIYIQWKPESVRSGSEVKEGGSIQEAIGKKAGLKFRPDQWYIKWGITLLAFGIMFQILGLLTSVLY